MVVKLSVKMRDSECTYKRDFLLYDGKNIRLDQDDEQIAECVATAQKEYGRFPESTQVKIEIEVV